MAGALDCEEEAEEHKVRGNGLLKEGKFGDAVEAYSKAIELHPGSATFWSNRSHANLKSGQLDAAVQDAEKAVALQPTWAKGHHRKAKALQELGRLREAAAACNEGARAAAASSEPSEKKLLERLQAELMLEAAVPALLGWWHGKVSAALGGFDQEFNFKTDGKMQCVVYGQDLEGTYKLVSVEESKAGGFTGGLDVNLNDTKVPYLFKVGEKDSMLHLCCPMNSPDLRPRTFDGPGYLGMQSGRLSDGDVATLSKLQELSEGQRIVRYLDELTDIMEANPALQENGGRDGSEAAERLEETGGGTVSASQVCGRETLEDRQKKLEAEQTLSALRLKYTAEVEDAAQKLIKREVKASSLYPPEEVKELEKRLRRFKPKPGSEEEQPEPVVEQPEPVVEPSPNKLATVAGSVEEQPEPVAEQREPVVEPSPDKPKTLNGSSLIEAELLGKDVKEDPPSPPKMLDNSLIQAELQSAKRKAPAQGGCLQGCFGGLSK